MRAFFEIINKNVEILEGEMERSMKQGKSLQKMGDILGVSRERNLVIGNTSRKTTSLATLLKFEV